MKTKLNTTSLALWVTRAGALVVIALLFAIPFILDWYSSVRALSKAEYLAILIAFYACAVPVLIALWKMDALLRSLLMAEIFVHENVRRIRTVQWCCFAVGVICIPAACIYYPLCFMVVIMGFLSLVIAVLCRVMDEAVSLREESDLTI